MKVSQREAKEKRGKREKRINEDFFFAEHESNTTYLLTQMLECAKSVQTCAEHQKCMTDDVLQLSRLRSHKLAITNAYYKPSDLVHTTNSFRAHAESKV
jgi:putative lipase involved disintegration of autophagic bodies